MQRNDQKIYQKYAQSIWKGTNKFERLLASQVHPRLEYFDRVTADWNGVATLDLGCGCGFMSEALARRGAQIIGIDPSANLLEVACVHAKSQGLKITYREGVGEAIPLPTNSVDRVVCVDVLEHVQDVGKVIAEVRRVLRPCGIFFFDTMNRNWLSRFMVVTLVEDVLRIIPRGAHDPAKFIRPEELKKYLEENGFTCTEDLVGMGIIRFNRHLDFEFGLTNSTQVMYIGHAT
jgi:2-polyprenyl-6-hydroxyphenyl methylase/3-demethylubiquinone-9 3-methyltransferase